MKKTDADLVALIKGELDPVTETSVLEAVESDAVQKTEAQEFRELDKTLTQIADEEFALRKDLSTDILREVKAYEKEKKVKVADSFFDLFTFPQAVAASIIAMFFVTTSFGGLYIGLEPAVVGVPPNVVISSNNTKKAVSVAKYLQGPSGATYVGLFGLLAGGTLMAAIRRRSRTLAIVGMSSLFVSIFSYVFFFWLLWYVTQYAHGP